MIVNTDFNELPTGKKLYFASDFHLGVPTEEKSLVRERKIIAWLDSISDDAAAIFLVGDVFDFWFEYKNVIPKGFIRFQGKLAELRDRGLPIFFFTGNHDMWMFDYFPTHLGIPVYREPIKLEVNGKSVYIGHGDGLGPGDHFYKFLKFFFNSRFCQWLFGWLHPNIGVSMAQFWSSSSRSKNEGKDDSFKGEDEWLYQFILDMESKQHHDYYIFGHRHHPCEITKANFKYVNLGEWVNNFSYAEFDGNELLLRKYEV